MSIHVISWVLKHSNAKGNDRMALLVFADKADDDGTDAFPSADRIAYEGRMARSTAIESRKRLVKQGRLLPDGEDPRGNGTPNFIVRMDKAAEGAPPALPKRDRGGRKADPPRGRESDPVSGGPDSDPGGPDLGTRGSDTPSSGGPESGPEPSKGTVQEPSEEDEVETTSSSSAQVVDFPPGFAPYLASLKRIASSKRERKLGGKSVNAAAALKACRDFRDRDLSVELDRFEHYWTAGYGQNRRLSDVARGWREWLRTSPPKGARAAKSGSASSRADADVERLEQMKRALEQGDGEEIAA